MNRDHYLLKRQTSLPPVEPQAESRGKTPAGRKQSRVIEPEETRPTGTAKVKTGK